MSKKAKELKQLIFKNDPYDNFDVTLYTFDDHGWFDSELTFKYLFELIKPTTYIECGVWKGKSLRWVAQWMKNNVDNPLCIGIDSWNGSIEHWDSTLRAKTKLGGMQLVNGYPQFYYQFLANTVISDLHDVIVPFPTTSLTAMRYLIQKGIKAEIIFIDASHEYPEVYDDLTMAKDLLMNDDSIIIGDDLCPWFPDVAKSVKQFLTENPGWKLLKDGFGFVLLQPNCSLTIKLPKKPPRVKKEKLL